jgi:hypothetical protein
MPRNILNRKYIARCLYKGSYADREPRRISLSGDFGMRQTSSIPKPPSPVDAHQSLHLEKVDNQLKEIGAIVDRDSSIE